jgi:hypothetical protein
MVEYQQRTQQCFDEAYAKFSPVHCLIHQFGLTDQTAIRKVQPENHKTQFDLRIGKQRQYLAGQTSARVESG